jgi:hypothetical protein
MPPELYSSPHGVRFCVKIRDLSKRAKVKNRTPANTGEQAKESVRQELKTLYTPPHSTRFIQDMRNKIINIYDYIDYRVLLSEEFLSRVAGNHGYSMRAFARDLNLSPGFLSEVMRGKKTLSLAKGRELFALMGLQGEELNYVENLITYRDNPDLGIRNLALSYLKKKYNRAPFEPDESKELLLKSADHFMIHGIVEGIPQVTEILAFTERILSWMQKNGGVSAPEKMCHMLVMGFDQDSYSVALEAHKHLIKTLCRISNQSKKTDHIVFYSDSLLTMSPRAEGEKLIPISYNGPEL